MGTKNRSSHIVSDRYDFLPAYTERGEQYNTLYSQKNGYFLTLFGSYNSPMVEVMLNPPLSRKKGIGFTG